MQAACPENQPFLQNVGETAEFSEKETNLMLQETPIERISAPTIKKMQVLSSSTDFHDELPRNLGALLKTHQ